MEREKISYKKDLFPVFLMGCLFVIIHGLALLVTGPFEEAGMQAFKEPGNPMNLVIFFVIIINFQFI